MSGWHIGRSWTGHPLEDSCPCPKEPCGLVALVRHTDGCPEHDVARAKTMRQVHEASDCPGAADALRIETLGGVA